MPNVYVLVGVPGSGKSTWVQNQDWAKSCAVVSTDAWVEAHAHALGKTYSEVFDEYMPHAIEKMVDDVLRARDQHKDIIWDQTSVSIASRKRKFKMLPEYKHIAVVFETPPADILKTRLTSRPGKVIPWGVISSMIANYQAPSLDEGYSEIWNAI